MKTFLLTSAAVFGLFGAPALASDLPTKAPADKAPIVVPPYNWSGFYAGVNFGGAWTNGSLIFPATTSTEASRSSSAASRPDTISKLVNVLLGIEGDIGWASFNHPALSAPTLGSVSHRWISTVAGRVGLVNDRWLVFAKLGGGWVHSEAALNVPGLPFWNGSSTNGGSLIGGGIEYGFKAHWTVKLEYDYLARFHKLEFGRGPGGGY